MNSLLALAAVTVCATACSGTEAKGPPDPVATVSTQTTCDLLFVDDEPRLWSQAVDLVASGGGGVDDVAEQLDEAATSSSGDLQPFIEKMAAAVRGDVDASEFKTAAREVANVCAPYVA